MPISIDDIANTAATWWVEAMKNDNDTNDYSGDDHNETMARLSLIESSKNREFQEELEKNLGKFKEILIDLVKEKLEDGNSKIDLVTDYGPCSLLLEAVKKSGIDNSCFPNKTTMVITKEDIKVFPKEGPDFKTLEIIKSETKGTKINKKTKIDRTNYS